MAVARLRLPTTGVRYDMFTQMLNASIFVIAKWHWQLHSQIPSKLSFQQIYYAVTLKAEDNVEKHCSQTFFLFLFSS